MNSHTALQLILVLHEKMLTVNIFRRVTRWVIVCHYVYFNIFIDLTIIN